MQQLALVWDRVNPYDTDRASKLTGDLRGVFYVMLDRKPHMVSEIAHKLNLPENSISAHLRHLRKEKFGNYNIVRKNITKGTSYYILMDGVYQRKEKHGK